MVARCLRASVCLSAFAVAFFAAPALAQNCVDTPEGRICQIQQPIVAGALVGTALEKSLGLVTVTNPRGGCSGVMMNRWWLLTARHCVTLGGVAGALDAPANITITATWAPGETATATRIVDFAVNTGAGVTPARDIVMVYFGRDDLGEVNRQVPYITQRQVTTVSRWRGKRLQTTDKVNQYGTGLSGFASGSFLTIPPTAVAAAPGGPYRTSTLTPSNITETTYQFRPNGAGQIGHAGDSGGPGFITEDGRVWVTGVQTTCQRSGTVPGAPIPPGATQANIAWATGINFCTYVSVQPLVREIGRIMGESPDCKLGAACAVPAIVEYVISSSDCELGTGCALPAAIEYVINP